MLYIITGPRGIGKTTALLSFLEKLKENKQSVSGIICPATYNENQEKTGFKAMDAATGEFWDLGRSDKKLDGPEYGPFSFSLSGFEKALSILKRGISDSKSILFLDEIGPLELHGNKGFYKILDRIDTAAFKKEVYVVIRPELIDEFQETYISKSKWMIIEINRENRNSLTLFNTRE